MAEEEGKVYTPAFTAVPTGTTAVEGMPPGVQQLLTERATPKVGKFVRILPPPEVEEPLPPERLNLETASLPELKEAFQKDMYAFLLQPWVKKALRKILEGQDRRGARELFTSMLRAMVPEEKHLSGGPTKVTLVSHIPRPGTQTAAVQVETK